MHAISAKRFGRTGTPATGFRISDFGFRVSGFEFRVSGFGCQVSGMELSMYDFGSGVGV